MNNYGLAFARALNAKFKEERDKIVEEETVKAVQKVHDRLTELAADVSLDISSFYSISDMKDHVLITVKFPQEVTTPTNTNV